MLHYRVLSYTYSEDGTYGDKDYRKWLNDQVHMFDKP